MSDTTHQILQDGRAYKVRIARFGAFIQEADGFAPHADAAARVRKLNASGS
jgi:hypothetical protein